MSSLYGTARNWFVLRSVSCFPACWVAGSVGFAALHTRLVFIVDTFQIAVATQFKAITGPPTPFGSNCLMLPVVSWAPISYASSVAFDSVVLILTLAKLHGNLKTTKSRIGKQIYKDNLLYFILTTVTNITVLSIQGLGSSYDMIKPTAIPFSTLMTVTMGTRVFLNLRLFDQRRQLAAAGIPLSINTGPNESATSTHKAVYDCRP